MKGLFGPSWYELFNSLLKAIRVDQEEPPVSDAADAETDAPYNDWTTALHKMWDVA